MESQFKHTGYAFWFKLLERLGRKDGHFIDLNNEEETLFIASKMGVSAPEMELMLNLLSRLEAIDPELWRKRIIWSGNFAKRLEDVYKKRLQKIPQKPVSAPETIVSAPETPISVESSAAIKLNKSKVNKSKEELFCLTSNEVRLSELLLSLIINRKADFKKPNIQLWAKEIDLMIRIDKREPERIEQVIMWCQDDSFWQNNILSTAKLRKQFDKLELKMKGDKNGSRGIKTDTSKYAGISKNIEDI